MPENIHMLPATQTLTSSSFPHSVFQSCVSESPPPLPPHLDKDLEVIVDFQINHRCLPASNQSRGVGTFLCSTSPIHLSLSPYSLHPARAWSWNASILLPLLTLRDICFQPYLIIDLERYQPYLWSLKLKIFCKNWSKRRCADGEVNIKLSIIFSLQEGFVLGFWNFACPPNIINKNSEKKHFFDPAPPLAP